MKFTIFILVILLFALTAFTAFGLGKQESSAEGASGEREQTESINETSTSNTEDPDGETKDIPQNDITAALNAVGIQTFDEPVKSIDFVLKDLNGADVSLSSFLGKVVFLNFWATWCGPCRAEMPSMQNLYESLGNDEFEIVAVNLQEGEDVVRDFVDQFGYTYPILLDSDGMIGGMYGARSIPTTYIVDKNGIILGGTIGGREWDSPEIIDTFRKLIENG